MLSVWISDQRIDIRIMASMTMENLHNGPEFGKMALTMFGRFYTLARALDHARAFLKVVDSQWRRKSCRPCSREHVIWSRAIVAEHLRCIWSQEDGTGVSHLRQQRPRVGNGKFQMFRRHPIDDVNGLI